MKLKTLLLSALVLTGMSVQGITAHAADEKPETQADVTFEANNGAEGGNPVVPGPGPEEKPTIDPTGPEDGKTNGALRIESVPGLSFGNQKISSKTERYDVLWGNGTVGGATKSLKIPQFAQVTDERGQKGTWKLTVNQEAPFTNKADATNKLTNTRIELHEQQLFNTIVADANPLLNGITGLAAGKSVDIPVGAGNALQVMATKTGQHTDSSKSSVTFVSKANYADDKTFYTDANQAKLGTGHSGIQLRAIGTDVKYDKATYTAKLVWTLSDSI